MPTASIVEKATNLNLDAPLTITAPPRGSGIRVEYEQYTTPLCAHPHTWIPISPLKTLYYSDSGLEVPGSRASGEPSFVQSIEAFKTEFRENIDSILRLYENRRIQKLREESMPRDLITRIRAKYSPGQKQEITYHEFLESVCRAQEFITGLGPKRTRSFLYTDLTDTCTPENRDDICMAACPHCSAAWWQFIPNDLKIQYLHQDNIHCPKCRTPVSDSGAFSQKRISVQRFAPPETDTYPEILPTHD